MPLMRSTKENAKIINSPLCLCGSIISGILKNVNAFYESPCEDLRGNLNFRTESEGMV